MEPFLRMISAALRRSERPRSSIAPVFLNPAADEQHCCS
jgi:hypothetical protein